MLIVLEICVFPLQQCIRVIPCKQCKIHVHVFYYTTVAFYIQFVEVQLIIKW